MTRNKTSNTTDSRSLFFSSDRRNKTLDLTLLSISFVSRLDLTQLHPIYRIRLLTLDSFSLTMSTQKKIVLSKPEDWDTWISFVCHQAESLGVCSLIDPSFPVRMIALSKPIKRIFDPGESAGTLDPKAFEFYKSRPARYNEQKTAFTAIISFIQETVTVENAILIQKVKSHTYNLLVALKQRLAPTDQARSLYLEKRYEKLKKGPGNQDIKTWVRDWQQMHTNTLTHGLAEVSGDRPMRDFLLAIYSKGPAYSTSQQNFQALSPCTMGQLSRTIANIPNSILHREKVVIIGPLLLIKGQLRIQIRQALKASKVLQTPPFGEIRFELPMYLRKNLLVPGLLLFQP